AAPQVAGGVCGEGVGAAGGGGGGRRDRLAPGRCPRQSQGDPTDTGFAGVLDAVGVDIIVDGAADRDRAAVSVIVGDLPAVAAGLVLIAIMNDKVKTVVMAWN